MTTDELISKAIHAINTNQPRLAQLYMRNALQQIDKQRRELNPLKWELRRLGDGFNAMFAAVSGMSHLFANGLRRALQIDESKARMNAEMFAGMHSKSDYALVGPSK